MVLDLKAHLENLNVLVDGISQKVMKQLHLQLLSGRN